MASGSREIEIGWLESGQPVVTGAGDDIGLSLSHDERLCLCVAGAGTQGCDIAPVTQRTEEAWRALLGRARHPVLDDLVAGGEPLDRAGTRLWAAGEALRKAGGASASLAIAERRGDDVLFAGGELSALTFPLRLTRGPERMVAVVVTPAAGARPEASAARPEVAAATAADLDGTLGFDFSSHAVWLTERGPAGRPGVMMRFPLTFREVANLSRTLYFSHFFSWLGRLRELATQPVYDELAEEFATGRWGMVTNRAETRIVGEVKATDVIEGCIWIDDLSGPHRSTQDLHYEWSKVLEDGRRERVAWSKMRATWVEIMEHGIVEARPLPEYFRRFYERLMTVPDGTNGAAGGPLPESVDDIDLGPILYAVPEGPINPALLQESVFETTLEDANLVGNLYFGNYPVWQGRTRDRFFQSVAPEYYRGTGEQGELRCAYSKVEHLREAMPFERIAVLMFLETLHERGVRLRFDYFREAADGRRDKLAFGEHVARWLIPAPDGSWSPGPLPDVLRDALRARAG